MKSLTKYDALFIAVALVLIVTLVAPLIHSVHARAVLPKIKLSAHEWRCVMFKSVPPVPAPEVDNCLMYLRKE